MTREARDEAGVRQAVADHTRRGRLEKEFEFYINYFRLPPRSLSWCLRELTVPTGVVPLWTLMRNLTGQHLAYFIVFVSINVELISSQGQGLCLYLSRYSRAWHTSWHRVRTIRLLEEWENRAWKRVPSDLFSSSLILFLAMSHLLFNPSLEVFILTIMFLLLKYLHGFFLSFHVF